MRPCLLVVRLTRPRRGGWKRTPPSSARHAWRAPAIHNRDQSTGSREGRLTLGHDVVVQSSLLARKWHALQSLSPPCCVPRILPCWDGTGRPLAVAYGRFVPVVEGSPPAHDWLPGRRGSHVGLIQLHPWSTPVHRGTVTVAGPVAGRGVISIHHSVRGRDVWSTYSTCRPTVAVGDHVGRGRYRRR